MHCPKAFPQRCFIGTVCSSQNRLQNPGKNSTKCSLCTHPKGIQYNRVGQNGWVTLHGGNPVAKYTASFRNL